MINDIYIDNNTSEEVWFGDLNTFRFKGKKNFRVNPPS